MNEIVNTFLLAGDKWMPEMDLKQSGFASSACGSFNKNKELRSLYRLEIQVLFKEMNLIKLVFNMICLMVSQKN